MKREWPSLHSQHDVVELGLLAALLALLLTLWLLRPAKAHAEITWSCAVDTIVLIPDQDFWWQMACGPTGYAYSEQVDDDTATNLVNTLVLDPHWAGSPKFYYKFTRVKEYGSTAQE